MSAAVLRRFGGGARIGGKAPEGRAHSKSCRQIRESLDSYPVLALTEAVFWEALQIRGRYGLSYWDSAIIAAALELGCHAVYSEDLNHGQSYAGVRVINPFVV